MASRDEEEIKVRPDFRLLAKRCIAQERFDEAHDLQMQALLSFGGGPSDIEQRNWVLNDMVDDWINAHKINEAQRLQIGYLQCLQSIPDGGIP